MPRYQGDLLDGETRLEQAASALVTKVVKMEVVDLQVLAGAAERRAGRPMIVGKDPVTPGATGRALSIKASASYPEVARSAIR